MAQNEAFTSWRSIVTLIVFIITNLIVVFPFSLTFPKFIVRPIQAFLVFTRVLPKPIDSTRVPKIAFPFNFVTAPLVSVLFLLAIEAIGRQEVQDGIIGANGIIPIDIMAFFLTLAYLAISIDTAGLVRVSAFWVLRKGGKYGHRLYFYLYTFFFCLGTFIGNDPIILSGTAFLAYMTRAASNIRNPRAWITAQFAVANISSAILVSSNPTNLVLAGAFDIKFIDYTVNMIVPTVITAIVLFPFLLYFIFASEDLIPLKISIHEHPGHEHRGHEQPVDTTPPHQWADGISDRDLEDLEYRNQLPLEEVLDPYLERFGAIFGGIVFALTLVAILVTNALHVGHGVYIITVPAAFLMLCRDLLYDWWTRDSKSRQNGEPQATQGRDPDMEPGHLQHNGALTQSPQDSSTAESSVPEKRESHEHRTPSLSYPPTIVRPSHSDVKLLDPPSALAPSKPEMTPPPPSVHESNRIEFPRSDSPDNVDQPIYSDPQGTLYGLCQKLVILWERLPFPTVKTVLSHLPFALIPFAFCMFIIVEGLVTKGWVEILAKGWAIWANKSNAAVAIAGMGFVSVCMCNFAGTNIGATILLSRVLQSWLSEHTPSERMVHGTIYALALGVNYGAFSIVFSASLAGLLWRDILQRKHIIVRRLDFARINVPIIAIAMAVGCSVLVGQVYLFRDDRIPICTIPHAIKLPDGTCP